MEFEYSPCLEEQNQTRAFVIRVGTRKQLAKKKKEKKTLSDMFPRLGPLGHPDNC